MPVSFDIWKMLAGVAVFLLGMNFMEEALRSLAGRRFKLFLKKQTANKIKAIGGGAVVTSILQSSSIVNLFVLSMVGAGVIHMQNALAVMLGSNLGTTVSNWVIALLGFHVRIENIALPVAGITGISLAFFTSGSRLWHWSRFLLGFSFIFLGLGFIKEGMENVVNQTDLTRFNDSPAVVFLLTGFVLTAIIQSSSATIALTLSALHAGAIDLYPAMAIVLGSEVGTTIKLFIASIKGIPAKKRVALGNFLFNTINVLIIFALLKPLYWFVTAVRLPDDLLSLVFFQSFLNLAGIFIFYPFLNVFGRFLENRFRGNDEETLFIHKVNPSDTQLAMEAMEKETRHFLLHILGFTAAAFEEKLELPPDTLNKNFLRKDNMGQYDQIKQLHGNIHQFSIQLQNSPKSRTDSERLEQLVSAVRNGMYAAKSIKDIFSDIDQLKNSAEDQNYGYYRKTREEVAEFCRRAAQLTMQERTDNSFTDITALYTSVPEGYTKSLQELYTESLADKVSEHEISTLLNFNREMYTTFKSLMLSLKDFLLTAEESDHFDAQPGFIR
ncbi:MAG TPA: Na/Pi symporter [Chitinophagaceae bacterium]|nr:Na/Pi symporter [Chitinophagaceae bacterium]